MNQEKSEKIELLDFQFLTPSKNAEKVDIYLSSIDKALKNDDVKNIAISGSYGAGKSSLIKTFEKKKNNEKEKIRFFRKSNSINQYNFLDISLATFKSNDNVDLSLIEKSILQQIFYKVNQEKIPFSRFKRISKIKNIGLKSFFILLSIFSLLIITDNKYILSLEIIEYLNLKSLKLFDILLLKFLSFFILLGTSFFFIKSIIQSFTSITLDKLNLKNLEISTNKPDENSLLNKYLDEILYFFAETNYNIVVFQDLDRFNNIEIFTKLRELNNFINNSEQVNKKIVFIYAIKDEMFDEEDSRTKFFDFMIPIIPYVNSSTSYDKLLEFFDKYMKDDLNFKTEDKRENFKEFLRDISLHIKDMRLLKNIYNEYLIYDKKIGKNLDKVKLLAMIIYKNFHPKDFHLLSRGEGQVFKIFEMRDELIKKQDNEYIEEISNFEKQIADIKNEQLINISELRKIYLYTIFENLNNPISLVINEKRFNFKSALHDDNFKLIRKSQSISGRTDYNSNTGSTSFKEIEEEVGNYSKRESLILSKDNISELLEEINNVKNKQKALSSSSIFKLCKTIDNKEKIKNELKEYELLYSLIINGHINENYYIYLSYSFNKSLTPSDNEFLISVINNTKLKYNYKLINIKEIVNRLKINEYRKSAILNYDLVSFLIKKKLDFQEQFNQLFLHLSNSSNESKSFIFDYIDYLPQQNSFIKEISREWNDIWNYIYQNKDFTKEHKEQYFYLFLYNLSGKEFLTLNKNDSLKIFLKDLTKIKDLVGEENEKMYFLINKLNIKFSNLYEPITNTPLFAYIYRNKHFVLNKLMIEQIIYTKYLPKHKIEKEFYSMHLTTIRELDKEKVLMNLIEENIELYIKNIFLTLENNKEESQETILWLLNNETLSDDLKERIIQYENTIIDNISDLNTNLLYRLIIKYNKLKATWENILLYYNEIDRKIDDNLINYLDTESNYEILSESKINNKEFDRDSVLEPFNKALMLCEEISNNAYKYLIKSIWFIGYSNLDLEHISYEKVSLMLDNNKFKFNNDNYENLKTNFELHIKLVENNSSELIENFESLNFESSDIIKILESENISSNIKEELVEKLDYSFVNTTTIADLIYKIKNKNLRLPIEYINNIVRYVSSVESKVNMIILNNNKLNEEELISLLNMLPKEYSKITYLDGKQTTIENTNYNRELISILENRNFITSQKNEKKNKIRLWIKSR